MATAKKIAAVRVLQNETRYQGLPVWIASRERIRGRYRYVEDTGELGDWLKGRCGLQAFISIFMKGLKR